MPKKKIHIDYNYDRGLTASSLIKKLAQLMAVHGDQPVYMSSAEEPCRDVARQIHASEFIPKNGFRLES